MPALPSVLNVARLSLIMSRGTDTDVVNRLFFNFFTAGGTSAGLNTLCSGVATDWNTNLAPIMGTQVTLTGVTCEDLTSPSSATGSATTSHAGTRSGTNMSASVCVVVKNEIARRYRGGHPRTYLPALCTPDQSSANVWAPSSLAAVITAWTAFITAVEARFGTWLSTGPAAHSNVSYYNGFHNVTSPTTGRVRSIPTLRTTPVVDTVIAYAANPNICSQRRRNQAP